MRPFDELRQMMQNFWMTPLEELGRWGDGFDPKVDIKEEDKEIIVSAELPGIDQKDIDVTVTNDSIRIAGEKKQEREKRREKGYLSPRDLLRLLRSGHRSAGGSG